MKNVTEMTNLQLIKWAIKTENTLLNMKGRGTGRNSIAGDNITSKLHSLVEEISNRGIVSEWYTSLIDTYPIEIQDMYTPKTKVWAEEYCYDIWA